MPSNMESLEKTNCSQHVKAFLFCKLAGLVIVQKNSVRPALLRQKNRTQFSRAERILFEEQGHGSGIAELSSFYPSGPGDFCSSRQAFSGDHHLLVHFRRNNQSRKQPVERREKAYFSEKYERRRIGDGNHFSRMAAERRSSSRSSKV